MSTARIDPPLPRRDRIAILSALAFVSALAWIYLVLAAAGMGAMEASAAGPANALVALRAWSGVEFALMFAMWAIMMVGMMLPSAAPTTLVYAAVARKAAREGTPIAPTAAFVAGYLVMWTIFSVGATLAQWGLDRAALLSPMMVSTSPALGAALLIAAGVYQLTPLKEACLRRCRSPVRFISEHWRVGGWGAFRMGSRHGAFCLGCCWLLMGLLFLGGVMNLMWIGGIAVFVLLEKALPLGAWGGRIAGIGMIVAGGIALAVEHL